MLEKIKQILLNKKVESVRVIESYIAIELDQIQLWIEMPWRLARGSLVYVGNGQLNESFSYDENKCSYYNSLVEKVQRLFEGVITRVSFNTINEIELELNSGYIFTTFQDYNNEDIENFRIYTTSHCYIIHHDRVEVKEGNYDLSHE